MEDKLRKTGNSLKHKLVGILTYIPRLVYESQLTSSRGM